MLDIVFQQIDHYQGADNSVLKDIFIQALAASLSFFVGYRLLRAQLKKDVEKNQLSKDSELRQTYDYTIYILQSNITLLQEQIVFLRQFIAGLKDRSQKGVKFNTITSIHIGWMDAISKIELHNAFFKYYPGDLKTKSDDLNNLMRGTAYIDKVIPVLASYYEQLNDTRKEAANNCSEHLQPLRELFDEIQFKLKDGVLVSEFESDLHNYILNFHKNTSKELLENIHYMNDSYLEEMLNLGKSHRNKMLFSIVKNYRSTVKLFDLETEKGIDHFTIICKNLDATIEKYQIIVKQHA